MHVLFVSNKTVCICWQVKPPHLQVMEKALCFMDSHIICLCAKLNIPEMLEYGPLTLKQLAKQVGKHLHPQSERI